MMKKIALAAIMAATVMGPATAQSAKPEVSQAMVYQDAASSDGDMGVALIFILILIAFAIGNPASPTPG